VNYELTGCGGEFVRVIRVVLELLTEDAHEVFAIEDSDKEDENYEGEEVGREACFASEKGRRRWEWWLHLHETIHQTQPSY